MTISIKYDQFLIQRVVNEVVDTVDGAYFSTTSVMRALILEFKKRFEKENINLLLAESPLSNFTHLLWVALRDKSINYSITTLEPLSSPAHYYEDCPADYESITSHYQFSLNGERERILRGLFEAVTEELKKRTDQEVISIIKTLPEHLRFDYYQRYSQIKGPSVDKQILPQLMDIFEVTVFPSLVDKLGIIGARSLYNELDPRLVKSQAFLRVLSHAEQEVVAHRIHNLRETSTPMQYLIDKNIASSEKEYRKLERKAVTFARELAKQWEKWQPQQKGSEKRNVDEEWSESGAPMETTPLIRKI